MQIALTFPLPRGYKTKSRNIPFLNEIIGSARTHWSKSSTEKKRWTAYFASRTRQQTKAVFAGPVWITCEWHVGQNLDPDNVEAARKFIFDGFVNCKLIPNDNCAAIAGTHNTYQKAKRGEYSVTVIVSDSPQWARMDGSICLAPIE